MLHTNLYIGEISCKGNKLLRPYDAKISAIMENAVIRAFHVFATSPCSILDDISEITPAEAVKLGWPY